MVKEKYCMFNIKNAVFRTNLKIALRWKAKNMHMSRDREREIESKQAKKSKVEMVNENWKLKIDQC